MYRVVEGDDGLFTVEPVTPGAAYPDAPKREFEALPDEMQKKLALLKTAGIGIPLLGIGEMVAYRVYHLDE